MLTIQFLCPLPNGLHARPAWELKEQCCQWQSEVVFINHRQNARADAKSSLALIGTGTLLTTVAACPLLVAMKNRPGERWRSTCCTGLLTAIAFSRPRRNWRRTRCRVR